ncbi:MULTISPECIES: ribosome maturation factor RimP [Gracilimonas]|uniref:Ribosome maturation factor RimP n=1 Tax=Gracilimonas sediminicola TaxID=2952158 RepID=A0A9X2L5D6_9BACT|nr:MULTISPECIES: ribosome maturation factor [Gracilimonas]MCP9292614.1 ribosome maturation factor [Gracilimonas sediminicola]
MQIDITQNIIDLAAPLAEEHDLFVVDVELKTHSGQTEVWVLLDTEKGGVNIDHCSEISRELGFLIEAHELFDKKYRLNVSSPGLSRPLSDLRQYKKNEGRVATIKFKNTDGEYKKIEGVITGIEDQVVAITDEEEVETQIPFDNIVETKIIPVI